VHKKIVWVAVRLPGEGPGERTVTVKSFKTYWRTLQKMAAWLAELGVTDAAMESTGGSISGAGCASPMMAAAMAARSSAFFELTPV